MMIILMMDRNRGNDSMTRFTDSPYEYMMTQKPHMGHAREKPQQRSKKDRCAGCPYGRDRHCAGICMKGLLATTKNGGIKRHETDT